MTVRIILRASVHDSKSTRIIISSICYKLESSFTYECKLKYCVGSSFFQRDRERDKRIIQVECAYECRIISDDLNEMTTVDYSILVCDTVYSWNTHNMHRNHKFLKQNKSFLLYASTVGTLKCINIITSVGRTTCV